MTNRNLQYVILTIILCIPIISHAQNKYGQETLEDGLLDPFIRYPAIPSHIFELRNRWAAETLKWVDKTLRAHPPEVDPPYIRIQALAAKKRGANVTAVDIDPEAIERFPDVDIRTIKSDSICSTTKSPLVSMFDEKLSKAS